MNTRLTKHDMETISKNARSYLTILDIIDLIGRQMHRNLYRNVFKYIKNHNLPFKKITNVKPPSIKNIKIVDNYLGFQIVIAGSGWNKFTHYEIFKNNAPFSIMTFISIKACKNVIDTHIKNQNIPPCQSK